MPRAANYRGRRVVTRHAPLVTGTRTRLVAVATAHASLSLGISATAPVSLHVAWLLLADSDGVWESGAHRSPRRPLPGLIARCVA